MGYVEFECLKAVGVKYRVIRENTGKPEVTPISNPGETAELFCSEATERGEVQSPRLGWTDEEGFRVSEADQVEWWKVGTSSRLLCASRNIMELEAWEVCHSESRAGLYNRHPVGRSQEAVFHHGQKHRLCTQKHLD